MRDWFAQAFGSAVADIRAKLIDEAWFGRRTPEQPARGDLGWSMTDHPRELAPDHQPDQGHDFDR
ncbi:MAG: hypothetical protein WC803_10025 [Sphingomonas sp.]|jgi:hypothetical protein